jgi:uncharacterized oxidoreductase
VQQSDVLIAADDARQLAAALLESAGTSGPAAAVVARHLTESDIANVRSHGLIRVAQYLDEIAAGELEPAAVPAVERAAGPRVEIDGNRCFGQVAGAFAVERALAATRAHGAAVVTVRRTGHVGRIGAYVEELARGGCVALAFCSGPRPGHWVAPFGAVEGRLATNPIAYAFPAPGGPVVADFSTSTVPEGVIRRLRDLGRSAPGGALQDAGGAATEDPGVLYGEPRGSILPLGGPTFGHKGYALGLLVEAMGTLLAGDETEDSSRYGNNLALFAVPVDEDFEARAGRLGDYVRSARPADSARPVLLPGDPERTARASAVGVLVDPPTWESLATLARARGVRFPSPLPA